MAKKHIWRLEYWKTNRGIDAPPRRSGLRLRFEKGTPPEVKTACLVFAKWLRLIYEFPVRIPVYIKASERICAMDGESVCGTFFWPFSLNEEPYIRLATGDYYEMAKKWDSQTAILEILRTFAHELTHYFQWVNNLQLTPIGEERQAKRYANLIISEYEDFLAQNNSIDDCKNVRP